MAPNFHPQHQKTLADNARAFYRKSGLGAQELDNARNAVSRKSNALLIQSRLRQLPNTAKHSMKAQQNNLIAHH